MTPLSPQTSTLTSPPNPSPTSTSNLAAPDYHGSEIALIGWAGRFPGSRSVAELWDHLQAGRECITILQDVDLDQAQVPEAVRRNPAYVPAVGVAPDRDRFDAEFFGFSPKEAEIMDPQHRLFLEHAWEALELAGYDPESYGGAIGVYAGVGLNSYLLDYVYPHVIGEGGNAFQALIRNDKDFLPTLVSYKLNLRGPSIGVQTACSTSLVAVHLACQSLLSGECDLALAGGATIAANPKGYLYEAGMIMSPDGHCRAFDAQAEGTVGGSGVGIVVLKRLQEAIADGDTIYAVIKGSAINNDGNAKVGYTAPSISGQAAAIAEALAMAEVAAETIDYVEAHGTGTTLGDPIEITALTQAFRQQTDRRGFCGIGSAKTNIGHLDTAAGVTGLIKAANALHHGVIPPSLHFQTPHPAIDFANSPFYVNQERRDWIRNGHPRRAGVSSFGIGGTNAHVILEEAPVPAAQPSRQTQHVLFLSARNRTALTAIAQQLADHLQQHLELDLADVAHTLAVGRKAFEVRQAFVCGDRADAIQQLRTYTTTPAIASTRDSDPSQPSPPMVALLFSGQGSQYVGMGRDLYDTEPVFRDWIDRAATVLHPEVNLDIRTILYPDPQQPAALDQAKTQLQQTALTQPIVFAVDYALAQVWLHWGLQPQAMLGHSLGEYVAACLAGVLSFEAALSLLATRGRLIQSLPAGAMLSVALTETEIQPWLSAAAHPGISLAAANGATCTVAGTEAAIAMLHTRLEASNIKVQRLHTSHAFHSAAMDPILAEFGQAIAQVSLQRPTLAYLSSVTGDWITVQEATDPQYWVRHLRQTVRFGNALGQLLRTPQITLLEVGPGKSLATLAQRHPDCKPDTSILTSLPHPGQSIPGAVILRRSLATLWQQNVECDRTRLYPNEARRRVPLPTYPFERQRHWLPSPDWSQVISSVNLGFPRQTDPSRWFYEPTWTRTPLGSVSPPLIPGQVWLVFSDDCGLSPWLIQTLAAQKQRVIQVTPAARWQQLHPDHFSLNPREPEQYRQLLQTLSRQDQLPNYVIHGWTLTPADPDPLAIKTVDRLQHLGLHSLLNFAQASGKVCPRQRIRLLTLSNGLWDLTGQEALSPAKATLLGAIKVIPSEYPTIQCTSADIDWPLPDSGMVMRCIHQVLDEIRNPQPVVEVAYRGSYRWLRHYVPRQLDQPKTQAPPLRSRGVYLVTGGLGGIGFTLAQHLATTVQARLVLVQRSPLPPRSQWNSWLATHPEPTDRTSQTLKRIQQLEAAGTKVLVAIADVANPQQMQAVITHAEQTLGPIQGVLHCAGMIDRAGIIQGRTPGQTDQVLAAKLQGSLVLHQLFQNRPLDFFVCSASLSTALHKTLFGQVGYGAANEFLTAFSTYYRNKTGTWTSAIQWTEWHEVGMAVDARQRLAQSGNDASWLIGLKPEEGCQVWERILGAAGPQVAVCLQDLVGFLAEQDRWQEQWQEAGVATPSSDAGQSKTITQTLSQPLEEQLCQLWQNCLGTGAIAPDTNFFDLGGDSLMGLSLLSQIQTQLGIQVPVNALIEAPSPQALAAYLRHHYSELSDRELSDHELSDRELSAQTSNSTTGNSATEHGAIDPTLAKPHTLTNRSATHNPTMTSPPLPVTPIQPRIQYPIVAEPVAEPAAEPAPTMRNVKPTPSNNPTPTSTLPSQPPQPPIAQHPPQDRRGSRTSPSTHPHGRPTLITLKQVNPQATPLWLMHPIGGGISCYRSLVRYLPTERPIYGIRAMGLEGETKPIRNLPSMAAYYLKTLRKQQPQGPYLLGGWSMGGVIAYEMAQQLHEAGEQVAGLLLIDSPAPIQIRPIPDPLTQLKVFCQSLGFTASQAQHLIEQLELQPERSSAHLQQIATLGEQLGVLPPGFAPTVLHNLLAVFQANTEALYNYVGRPYSRGHDPLGQTSLTGDTPPFSGVTRFIAAQGGESEGRWLGWWRSQRITDADTVSNWEYLLGQTIQTSRAPGTHYTMVNDPQVYTLATQIQQWLQAATLSQSVSQHLASA